MTKELFYVLASATLVDRVEFNKLPAINLDASVRAIYSGALNVVFTDNIADLKSLDKLIAAIDSNSNDLALRFELNGLVYSPEAKDVIANMTAMKANIRELIASQIPPLPPYTFDPNTPRNYDVMNDFTFGTVRINRKGSGHGLGIRTAAQVWLQASKVWSEHKIGTTPSYLSPIRTSGYSKTPQVRSNEIRIGCQTLMRYEVEQVALKMGWAFPEPVTPVA